jgi:hypothetical protein
MAAAAGDDAFMALLKQDFVAQVNVFLLQLLLQLLDFPSCSLSWASIPCAG